jgi:hypothetical protein
MKWIGAAFVCLGTLVGIDRVAFKGTYVAALKSSAADSAGCYR